MVSNTISAVSYGFVRHPQCHISPAVLCLHLWYCACTHDNTRCTRTLNRAGTMFTGTGMGMIDYTRGLPVAITMAGRCSNVVVLLCFEHASNTHNYHIIIKIKYACHNILYLYSNHNVFSCISVIGNYAKVGCIHTLFDRMIILWLCVMNAHLPICSCNSHI
jgi:hypothetical protein